MPPDAVARAPDPLLIALSYLIAVLAASVALRVAARAAGGSGRASAGWWTLSALALGAGIWSTHFVAMLALALPVPGPYDAVATGWSLVAAALLAGGALRLAAHDGYALWRLLCASVVLAIAIASMHFTAMPAMPASSPVSYDAPLLRVVLAIGVAASLAALRMAAHARDADADRARRRRLLAAIVLGLAMAGVDYGIAAASRFDAVPPGATLVQPFTGFWLAAAIACVATLLLAVAMLVGDTTPVRPAGVGRFTLRIKIAGAFLLATLLAGGLVVTALVDRFAEAERAALYEAHHIARAIAIAGGRDVVRNPEVLRRYLTQLHERDDRTVYALDPAQRVVASFDPGLTGLRIADAPAKVIAAVLADGVRRPAESLGIGGPPERVLVAPLRAEPTDIGSAVIGVLVVEYSDLHDTLVASARASAEWLSAIGIAVVVLIALLGSRVAAAIATPIAEMERSAAELAQGRYDVAVPVRSHDEIGALGTAFNRMAQELRAGHERNLAHQHELEERVVQRTAAWQHAANAHRQTADELQTIVDHLPLALAYVDRSLVVRHHNARFAAWCGCADDAIDGRPAHEVLGTENYARVEGHITRVLAGDEVSYERPNVTRDGTRQLIASSLVPRRDDDGSVVGFYAMVQDITERQRATEALRRTNAHLSEINQRLRQTQEQLLQVEKMASIGQLASGVAHEINNPIGYVYSNLGTLDKYLDGILCLLDRYGAAESKIADPATLADCVRRRTRPTSSS